MNKKLQTMMREIEQRGGIVGMSDSIPDEIAERFFSEILDCPDCREAAKLAGFGNALREERDH